MHLSLQDCRSPAPLTCSLQGTCIVALLSDIVIPDCFYKYADYIGVEYRFLPRILLTHFFKLVIVKIFLLKVITTKNSTLCKDDDLILKANSSGVITSPNYPHSHDRVNCIRRLIAPKDKIIKIYLTDLLIDYPDEFDE